MFSGIIQDVGTVTHFSRYQKQEGLKIRSKTISARARIGDSVSVNGVCLTLTKKISSIMSFDVLTETSAVTTLGSLRVGERVNLEASLGVGDTISGHFVSGHVDCTGTIAKKGVVRSNHFFEIAVPLKFMHLLTPKGSVAIDGISLTVAEVFKDSFIAYIIPHTLHNTVLSLKSHGRKVNIEFDILAKYASNALRK